MARPGVPGLVEGGPCEAINALDWKHVPCHPRRRGRCVAGGPARRGRVGRAADGERREAGAGAAHERPDHSLRRRAHLPQELARPELRRGARRGRELEGHSRRAESPGQRDSGPIYGNASTQLLEFDSSGKFVREIGEACTASAMRTACGSTSTTTCGSSTKAQLRDEVQSCRLCDDESGTAAGGA